MDRLKPSRELRQKIILGIIKEEQHSAKVYFFAFSAILLVSLVGVVASFKYLMQGFTESGFYEYLSLLFSGDSTVYIYWKELSLSLIDSMPVIGIIAFLTAIAVLIWSGANTFTNTHRFILQVN